MANCKFILTLESGDKLEFKNEEELDRYLEHKILFSTTPFSKININKLRDEINTRIASKTNDAILKLKNDKDEDIHKYEDSKGTSYSSVTEYIKDETRNWLLSFKREDYRKNTEVQVASELLSRPLDDVSFKSLDEDDKKVVDKYYEELFAEWENAPKYGNFVDDVFNHAVELHNSKESKADKAKLLEQYIRSKGFNGDKGTKLADSITNTINSVLKKYNKEKVLLFSQKVLTDKIGDTSIAGSPDLFAVVLDSNNKPKRIDVYDLKTSYKPLTEWEAEKLKAYVFQTTMYARMIQRMFADKYPSLEESQIYLLQHTLEMINRDGDVVNDLKGIGDVTIKPIHTDSLYTEAIAKIDEVLPAKETKLDDTKVKLVLDDLNTYMTEVFDFSVVNDIKGKELDAIKSKFVIQSEDGKFLLKGFGDVAMKSFNNEEDLNKELPNFVNNYNKYITNLGNSVKEFIILGRDKSKREEERKNIFSHPSKNTSNAQNIYNYYKAGLHKYIEDKNWNVFDVNDKAIKDELSKMGIVLMHNPVLNKIDVIVASALNLNEVKKGIGTTLAGKFKADGTVQDKGLFSASYANLEAMKGALYAFAQDEIFDNKNIGRIVVVSAHSYPVFEYAHDFMDQVKKVKSVIPKLTLPFDVDNTSRLDNITVDVLEDMVQELIALTSPDYDSDDYVKEAFNSQTNINRIHKELLENNRTKQEQIEYLEKLLKQRIPNAYKGNRINSAIDINELIGRISSTIAYLKGTSSYRERDFVKLYMYTKNPDSINSASVRAVVKIIKNALFKVNEELYDFHNRIKSLKEKKEKLIVSNYHLGKTAAFIVGTHDNVIYNNLFEREKTKDGSIGKRTMYFKDPLDTTNDLSPVEREFLIDYIKEINQIRIEKYAGRNSKLAEEYRTIRRKQLEVPLMKARGQSVLIQQGLYAYVKDKYKIFFDGIEKFTNSGDLQHHDLEVADELHRVIDYFSVGDNNKSRATVVSENKDTEFESNLEAILYEYKAASLKQEHYDKALSEVNTISLANAYHRLNTLYKNPNQETWVKDYKDRLLLDRKDFGSETETLNTVLTALQKTTSLALIALNPFSGATAFMTNFFTLASSVISKNRLAKEQFFSPTDLAKAIKVMAEHFDNSFGNDNLVESLNRQYQLVNMDKFQLIQNLKDRRGVMQFLSRNMYYFNTAPDYFFRMIMFIAQMEKDGLIDAHDKVTGEYNYKKDPRIAAYVNKSAPESSEEYKKAEAFYHYLVSSLKKENSASAIRIVDGKEVPMRAYPFSTRDSVKLYADQLLGFYDEETKGTWANWIFTRLFMQFHTWALANRDRWWKAKHPIQLPRPKEIKGDFVTDENGNTNFIENPNGKDFIYQHEGSFSEGAIQSLLSIFQSFRGNLVESELQGYKRYTTAAKQSIDDFEKWRLEGLMHALSDLFMFLMGTMVTALISPEKKNDKTWITNNFIRSFNNSYRDLSPINLMMTLGVTNKLPLPAISYMIKLQEQFLAALVGDITVSKFVFSNLGLTRPYYPVIREYLEK